MDFVVFQRPDSALLVVPALFLPPVACEASGAIKRLGRCYVELDTFSPDVAEQLGRDGYAVVVDGDCRTVKEAMAAGGMPATVEVHGSDGSV